MLDMGFIRDIRKILAVLPPRRQNLLFSATFSNEIRRLADTLLDDPAAVQVTPRNTPTELVTQVVHMVDRERKRELLSHLIKTGRIDQALVFTRTKHGANRLALQLAHDGILATAIHGNKSQPQRVRALADFKAGRFAVLVATEVAARGLDIDSLPHVVNFELPMVPEDYVHRIGRTGRAGKGGKAVTFVAGREIYRLENIQRFTRSRIRRERIPTAEEVEGKRATAFADALRETLEKGEYKRHDELLDRLLEQNYSPTDIASALIHLLGEDKARGAEAIPEDRHARDAAPLPRRSPSRAEAGDRSLRAPDPTARDRRERGRDD
jgi:ATP-dependent RNA helicase RhlE